MKAKPKIMYKKLCNKKLNGDFITSLSYQESYYKNN